MYNSPRVRAMIEEERRPVVSLGVWVLDVVELYHIIHVGVLNDVDELRRCSAEMTYGCGNENLINSKELIVGPVTGPSKGLAPSRYTSPSTKTGTGQFYA